VNLPTNMVLVGDALERLRELPDASVDTVVTSPPYFGLRDYQVDQQIGLEPSVHDWVKRLVAVSDELTRVLTPTGSLWLNVGDSYSRRDSHGAPPKGLVLAPERLLLTLASHGWRVRNKVVWAKPNPMPASVRDRLSASWEPLYLLVRGRHYYFDLDPIREPHTSARPTSRRTSTKRSGRPEWAGPLAGDQSGLDRLHLRGLVGHPLGRNPRDVWIISTSGGSGGHHATFPEALIERPIMATCPERVCVACQLPWERERPPHEVTQIGQPAPKCRCKAGTRSGIVLDPFIGSGTTAIVAERLGRDWVGIELNRNFAEMATRRIRAEREERTAAA